MNIVSMTGTLYRDSTATLCHSIYGDDHNWYSLKGEFSEELGLHLLDLPRLSQSPCLFYGARVRFESPKKRLSIDGYGWVESVTGPLKEGITPQQFEEFSRHKNFPAFGSLSDLTKAIHQDSPDPEAIRAGVELYDDPADALDCILKVGPVQKNELITEYFHRVRRWQEGTDWINFIEIEVDPKWIFKLGDRVHIYEERGKKHPRYIQSLVIGPVSVYKRGEIAIPGYGYFDRTTGEAVELTQEGVLRISKNPPEKFVY